MSIDWNFLSFVWAVLLVPIGWLYNSYKKQNDTVAALEKLTAEQAKDITFLKEKLVPLSNDLAELNKTILRSELDMEKRLHAVTLDNFRAKNKE